jgi:hypothetical protein
VGTRNLRHNLLKTKVSVSPSLSFLRKKETRGNLRKKSFHINDKKPFLFQRLAWVPAFAGMTNGGL